MRCLSVPPRQNLLSLLPPPPFSPYTLPHPCYLLSVLDPSHSFFTTQSEPKASKKDKAKKKKDKDKEKAKRDEKEREDKARLDAEAAAKAEASAKATEVASNAQGAGVQPAANVRARISSWPEPDCQSSLDPVLSNPPHPHFLCRFINFSSQA